MEIFVYVLSAVLVSGHMTSATSFTDMEDIQAIANKLIIASRDDTSNDKDNSISDIEIHNHHDNPWKVLGDTNEIADDGKIKIHIISGLRYGSEEFSDHCDDCIRDAYKNIFGRDLQLSGDEFLVTAERDFFVFRDDYENMAREIYSCMFPGSIKTTTTTPAPPSKLDLIEDLLKPDKNAPCEPGSKLARCNPEAHGAIRSGSIKMNDEGEIVIDPPRPPPPRTNTLRQLAAKRRQEILALQEDQGDESLPRMKRSTGPRGKPLKLLMATGTIRKPKLSQSFDELVLPRIPEKMSFKGPKLEEDQFSGWDMVRSVFTICVPPTTTTTTTTSTTSTTNPAKAGSQIKDQVTTGVPPKTTTTTTTATTSITNPTTTASKIMDPATTGVPPTTTTTKTTATTSITNPTTTASKIKDPATTATCGPVCMIHCFNGNVKDSNGCPTCKCNPLPPGVPPTSTTTTNTATTSITNPTTTASKIKDPATPEPCDRDLDCEEVNLLCKTFYRDVNDCPTCQCHQIHREKSKHTSPSALGRFDKISQNIGLKSWTESEAAVHRTTSRPDINDMPVPKLMNVSSPVIMVMSASSGLTEETMHATTSEIVEDIKTTSTSFMKNANGETTTSPKHKMTKSPSTNSEPEGNNILSAPYKSDLSSKNHTRDAIEPNNVGDNIDENAGDKPDNAGNKPDNVGHSAGNKPTLELPNVIEEPEKIIAYDRDASEVMTSTNVTHAHDKPMLANTSNDAEPGEARQDPAQIGDGKAAKSDASTQEFTATLNVGTHAKLQLVLTMCPFYLLTIALANLA